MRVAIVSDIHGNRHALEAVLARRRPPPARASCGAWATSSATAPTPTTAARSRAGTPTVCLAGNHDLAVTGTIPLDEFSHGAALAARWTQEVHRRRPRRLAALARPRRATHEGVGLYHASPRDPVWEYVLSTLLAELCLDAAPERVCLVGHSHVALSFVRPEGEAATGDTRRGGRRARPRDRRVARQPRQRRAAARRRPARGLAAARHRRLAGRSGGARSTTSRAPRRRSARPACPTRSPSASEYGQ